MQGWLFLPKIIRCEASTNMVTITCAIKNTAYKPTNSKIDAYKNVIINERNITLVPSTDQEMQNTRMPRLWMLYFRYIKNTVLLRIYKMQLCKQRYHQDPLIQFLLCLSLYFNFVECVYKRIFSLNARLQRNPTEQRNMIRN